MAFIFKEKPVATIKANLDDGSENQITIGGVTAGTTTADNATVQINKILDIAGKAVVVQGMQRIKVEEAVNNA